MNPKDIENPIAEEDFREQSKGDRYILDNRKCTHEFITKEFKSQLYGTCLVCGQTIFNINLL